MTTTESETGTQQGQPGGQVLQIGNREGAETIDVHNPKNIGEMTSEELVASLVCPECFAANPGEPRTFKTKGSLGKHRSSMHQVAGTSRPRKPRAQKNARKGNEGDAVQQDQFDMKKAMSLIFPSGMIPADPEVMQQAMDWAKLGQNLHHNTRKYRK